MTITIDGRVIDLSKPTLGADDVAALLGVAPWTVYHHARAGDLPPGLEPIKVERALRWPTRRVVEALGLGAV